MSSTTYTTDIRSQSRLPEPTKEISVIEHQCSYGSIMNLLEIWADGSIQGYLSAKQTLRIIERVKARESPR